jgi:acyl-CoA synthetase (AMP-forming)/AMP-acid ligase II
MTHLPIGNLADLLRVRAATLGDAYAYGFLADGEQESGKMTYAELDRRASILAGALSRRAERGAALILAYPPGLDFIVAFCACMYAGMIAVPVCPPHPRKRNDRLASILADAGARFVLTTASVAQALACSSNAWLGRVEVMATDTYILAADDGAVAVTIDANAVAFMQYTSGSTAAPRGVLVSHANVLANLAAIHRAEGNGSHSRGVSWLPHYHDMGLIEGILQPMYGGYPTWLMPPAAFLQRPRRWLAAISRYRATVSGGPNFAYEHCVRHLRDTELPGVMLDSWQVAYCGAEPIRAATLDAFATRFAANGFKRAALRPVYGLAEATLLVTASDRALDAPRVVRASKGSLAGGYLQHAEIDTAGGVDLVSCGRPSSGTEVAIADPDSVTLYGEGRVGEIVVRGPAVSRGYHRGDMAMLASGGREQGQWLRTGDLGFTLDGELFVCGRRKDLMILRGRKLHPQDIEDTAVACPCSPPVVAAAAFATAGADGDQLVLCIELSRRDRTMPSGSLQPALARAADAIRVAVYREHEVPMAVVAFVPAGSLPRTTSGKLMRFELRREFIDGTLAMIARFTGPVSRDIG